MSPDMDGRVAEELAELRGMIKNFIENWRIQDERASTSRRELYQKILDLQVTQAGFIRNLAEVTMELSKQEPKIRVLETAYNRGWGVVWLGRILFGVLVAIAVWLLDRLGPFVMKGK